MNSPLIIVPKNAKLGEGFSKKEILKAAEHPGRQTNARRGYQSASTFINHLLGLNKPVILCSFCRPKFNPKKAKYRRFYCLDSNGQNGYVTNGRCDDCKEDTRRTPGGGTMFIPEETYPEICLEPHVARRSMRARLSCAGQTAWQAIQQSIRS